MKVLSSSEETSLQLEYIEKVKELIAEIEREKGRKLTCCVTTFYQNKTPSQPNNTQTATKKL